MWQLLIYLREKAYELQQGTGFQWRVSTPVTEKQDSIFDSVLLNNETTGKDLMYNKNFYFNK